MDVEAVQRRGLRDWLRWLGNGSPGASVLELDGVTGAIVPAVPERSITNSLVYDDAAQLEAAYPEIDRAYRDAGIAAWTVWTPDGDRAAIDLLTGAGHSFDGEPLAMTMDLATFEPPPLDGLEWDRELTLAEMGAVNDSAYGIAEDGMAAAFDTAPDHLPLRLYRALEDGKTASVLGTIDHDDDLGIYFVATGDAHRGKGLARRLLAAALVEGRDRGLRTSSLQSSAKGQPVYERLGYHGHYRLHLYERRYDAA